MAYANGPFLAPHLLVKWGGTLPGPEEWSCQLRMGRVGAGPWPNIVTPPGNATITGIVSKINATHSSANTRISPRAIIKYIKVNMIGVDGRYALLTSNSATVNTAGGGVSTTFYPNQVSLCVNLRTAVDRGVGHNSRMFLPLPSALVGIDGLITTADQLSVASAINDMVTALNTVDPNYVVAVMSRKLGAPTQRPVIGTRVGRVLDTQQRRRADIKELYTSV